MNFADRLAVKGHSPDLTFILNHLDCLDAFRLEIEVLPGDFDSAITIDLLPRWLRRWCGRRGSLNASNYSDKRQDEQMRDDQIHHQITDHVPLALHLILLNRSNKQWDSHIIHR